MDRAAAELSCADSSATVPSELAGADGLDFTKDDPWIQAQGTQLTP